MQIYIQNNYDSYIQENIWLDKNNIKELTHTKQNGVEILELKNFIMYIKNLTDGHDRI